MILKLGFVLFTGIVWAAAEPAPALTKQVQEERGRCQTMVPADAALPLPFLAQGPQKSYSVLVEWNSDTYKPQSEAELKEWHYTKVYENSAARQIVEKDPKLVGPDSRAIHVYLPLEHGRCHAGISFKNSVSEALMLSIARSVAAAK